MAFFLRKAVPLAALSDCLECLLLSHSDCLEVDFLPWGKIKQKSSNFLIFCLPQGFLEIFFEEAGSDLGGSSMAVRGGVQLGVLATSSHLSPGVGLGDREPRAFRLGFEWGDRESCGRFLTTPPWPGSWCGTSVS